MTKINKITIILFLLVFCALCSFGLVGCRSKAPSDQSYWYGTYKYDASLTRVIIEIEGDDSSKTGMLSTLRQDGIDMIAYDGLRSYDFEWGTDNYSLLQWEIENIQHDVIVNKKGFHMGHGIMQWAEREFISELSKDPASIRSVSCLGLGSFDQLAVRYSVVLPITLPEGNMTIEFFVDYIKAK